MNTAAVQIDTTATGTFSFVLAGMVRYQSLAEMADALYDRPVRRAPRTELRTGCKPPPVGVYDSDEVKRFAVGY